MTANTDPSLSETTVTVTVNGISVTVGEFDEMSNTECENTVTATVAHVLDDAGYASTEYRLYKDVTLAERNISHRITGTHDFEDGSRYVAVPNTAFHLDGNEYHTKTSEPTSTTTGRTTGTTSTSTSTTTTSASVTEQQYQ